MAQLDQKLQSTEPQEELYPEELYLEQEQEQEQGQELLVGQGQV